MPVVTHALPLNAGTASPLSGLVTSFGPWAQTFTSRLLHAPQFCPRLIPGKSIPTSTLQIL